MGLPNILGNYIFNIHRIILLFQKEEMDIIHESALNVLCATGIPLGKCLKHVPLKKGT
jgi:hypothetical protein